MTPGAHPGQAPGEAPVVVVVGAGIAGLAAAARVVARRPEITVRILESSDRIGGKLHRAEVGGVTVDVGAEAMLNRRPEAVGLARESGLGEDIVHPATISAHLWNRDRLVPLPRTLMGVPGDVRVLEDVLSRSGQIRAALETRLPATEIGAADVSIGHLVEERFGKEVVDRLVEPLLGGVYAGHAREISARAAVPQVVALLDRDRSLTRAAAEALSAQRASGPVFAGIRGGVGRLPTAIVEAHRFAVEIGSTVRDLAHRPGGGWRLLIGDTRAPRLVDADGVVLATPARTSARLLSDVAPYAALELARIEYASMAIVTLAFSARDFPPVEGSGFLVPPVDGHVVKAATFSHRKWDWVAEASGDLVVMRCSIGRHREEQVLQVDDEELVRLAVVDLGRAIGLSARPVEAHVQRWGGALPQYAVGHRDRVESARRDVTALRGIALCGAAYDGLGIPACIASAYRAADEVLAQVGTMES